jgi:hypothetical protein
MANEVAMHVSLGVFAGSRRAIRSRLSVGVRGGIGGTRMLRRDTVRNRAARLAHALVESPDA